LFLWTGIALAGPELHNQGLMPENEDRKRRKNIVLRKAGELSAGTDRAVRSHTKTTATARQDLISLGEDASDINSHTTADASQKHRVAQALGTQHFFLSKAMQKFMFVMTLLNH